MITQDLQEFLQLWNALTAHILLQTSGSTGKPKLIWIEKQKMRNSAKMTLDFLQIPKRETALLCLPLQYIAGMMMVVRSIVGELKLAVVEPSLTPLKGLTSAPYFIALTPAQLAHTLANKEETQILLQIKHVLVGGGAVSETLVQKIKNFPNAIWSTYGMTETVSHIAMRKLSQNNQSDYYTPLSNVQLAQNKEKCLIIKAPLLCNDTLVTNDVVELLPTQQFKVMGRIDNVVCSGGIKIQIEVVEKQLATFLTCGFALTAIPDSAFGEVLVLVYQGKENEEEIKEKCKNISNKYHRPKYYVNIPSFPLTNTGKINRWLLKEIAQIALNKKE